MANTASSSDQDQPENKASPTNNPSVPAEDAPAEDAPAKDSDSHESLFSARSRASTSAAENDNNPQQLQPLPRRARRSSPETIRPAPLANPFVRDRPPLSPEELRRRQQLFQRRLRTTYQWDSDDSDLGEEPPPISSTSSTRSDRTGATTPE